MNALADEGFVLFAGPARRKRARAPPRAADRRRRQRRPRSTAASPTTPGYRTERLVIDEHRAVEHLRRRGATRDIRQSTPGWTGRAGVARTPPAASRRDPDADETCLRPLPSSGERVRRATLAVARRIRNGRPATSGHPKPPRRADPQPCYSEHLASAVSSPQCAGTATRTVDIRIPRCPPTPDSIARYLVTALNHR